jgi:microcystin-dependent protein
MAQPYVGEIRMFAGNFAPLGWNFCDGTMLSIGENTTLHQLIGTTYGGDGQTTFQLPDLRGRVPLHMGQGTGLNNYIIGQSGGLNEVTLSVGQLPSHSHNMNASGAIANASSPTNAILAASSQATVFYGVAPDGDAMHQSTIGSAGGSQPHSNLQPYVCISFIIALQGLFPSQS